MKNFGFAILCVLPFVLLVFGEIGTKMIFWGIVFGKIAVWWNPFEIEINKVGD